jgi:preprotein translocase subunit SecG
MLEVLHTPFTVLHITVAVLLILLILIQPGKSGGLSAALGAAGSQQVFGGRGAGTFLSKGTWVLAATFFTTSVVLAYISTSTETAISLKSGKGGTPAPAAAPPAPSAAAAPTPAPPSEPAEQPQ